MPRISGNKHRVHYGSQASSYSSLGKMAAILQMKLSNMFLITYLYMSIRNSLKLFHWFTGFQMTTRQSGCRQWHSAEQATGHSLSASNQRRSTAAYRLVNASPVVVFLFICFNFCFYFVCQDLIRLELNLGQKLHSALDPKKWNQRADFEKIRAVADWMVCSRPW